jgi:SAM-dependent methyltransferase
MTIDCVVSEREAWSVQEHAQAFDYMHATPDFILKKHYESFNEGRLLNYCNVGNGSNKFFEIGCATGELYRYISKYRSDYSYHGFDISEPTIARAKQKYPKANFHLLIGGPEEILQNFGQPEVVWCRDVVFHQNDPYFFLDNLISLAKESLIVRLRTRDIGDTVFDTQLSCQLHWDKFWVPYIVLNTDELIRRIERHQDVKKIVVCRAYEVLGGHNHRFLPKELFFSNSRTAETALLIQKGSRSGNDLEISFMDQLDRPRLTLGEKVVRKLFDLAKNRRFA